MAMKKQSEAHQSPKKAQQEEEINTKTPQSKMLLHQEDQQAQE